MNDPSGELLAFLTGGKGRNLLEREGKGKDYIQNEECFLQQRRVS